MAYSESGDIKFLLFFGLFVLASSFCHCTTVTRQALDKLGDNSTLSQGQAKGSALHHGRLLIGQNSLQGAKLKGTKATKSLLHVDTDYQADMGWVEHRHRKAQSESFSRLQPDDAMVERLLKMEPKVECTGDSMKLQVQGAASTPGSLFFVDRGSWLSPLPLSKLPPSCGYTFRSTQRELVLVAPYDGCFVALEADSYVLPLRWWGVPVRMSCPLMRPSSPNPPMVTCYTRGMVVKTEWTVPVAKIKVNLNGNWEPLMTVSTKCGFSLVAHPEGVIISVHYAPCLEKKGGMYTLELAGDGETKISCPSLSVAQTEMPSKGLPVFTPSHNSGPGYVPTQSPQSAVPQLPGFPQNPEANDEKPKDIYQPQLPYFPFYPSFFHPHPGAKPSVTLQPSLSPVTKNNELQSHQTISPNLPVGQEGQVPQPFVPFPFYPWLTQPEEIPVEKETPLRRPATQTTEKEVNPFYLYPYNVKPPNTDVPHPHWHETKPLPTSSPPTSQSTRGQRQQPYYPFPFYPQPPKPETPPIQPPATKPPQGNLETVLQKPPFPFGPPQKPVEPPANQPGKHKPFYSFPPYLQPPAAVQQPLHPLYPEIPGKPLPEKNIPPESPASQGQIYPFYHYPVWPQGPFQTNIPLTEQTSTAAPKGQAQQPLSPLQPSELKVPDDYLPSKPPPQSKELSQPESPQGQIHQYPYPFYPQPQPTEKPTAVQQPSQPEPPQGQVHQYPYPFYPQPQPTEKPTTVQQPSQPESPQGQVHQYPYPFYAQPQPTEKPTTVQQPSQPEPSQGQVHQYPYPFYPQPQPTEKSTTFQPSQPEAPWGQVHQPIYPPYHFYLQPKPENQPSKKPMPKLPDHQPYNIPGAETNGAKTATEKPNTGEQPPDGQVYHHFNANYPQHPQPTKLPSATSMQNPQPGSPYIPPLHCPQYCPSGFSNCCLQIAFHQHLHHIIPAGLGSKEAPPVNSALPLVPSLLYSGLDTGVLLQKPTEATQTSPQAPPPENEKQPHVLPPDGNPGVLMSISKHSKPINPELPTYPYFVPNSIYPNWLYKPQSEMQNLQQSQSNNAPSKPPAPGNNPVNPVVQYKPYYIQPPEQQVSPQSPMHVNNPPGPNSMSFIGQYQKREHATNQQNEPTAEELQPSHTESREQMQPKGQSQLSHFQFPYMLQDAQASIYNLSQSQIFMSGSKKSPIHDQTVHSYTHPKRYLLLQHSPPAREPNSFHQAPLPFGDLVHDANVQAQTYPHNLNPLQDKPLHLKWLGKKDSYSTAHLKPESLKNTWKPVTPLGSSRRIPAQVPGNPFQQ